MRSSAPNIDWSIDTFPASCLGKKIHHLAVSLEFTNTQSRVARNWRLSLGWKPLFLRHTPIDSVERFYMLKMVWAGRIGCALKCLDLLELLFWHTSCSLMGCA